ILVVALPLLVPLIPLEVKFLPLIFFALTVPVLATLMLLAFWMGMGVAPFGVRVLGAVGGAMVIALTTSLGLIQLEPARGVSTAHVAHMLFSNAVVNVLVVATLGTGFLIYRRRVRLQRVCDVRE